MLDTREDGIEKMYLGFLLTFGEVTDIKRRHLVITQDRLNSELCVVEERSDCCVNKLMFASSRIDAVLGTIGNLSICDERVNVLKYQPINGAIVDAAIEQG